MHEENQTKNYPNFYGNAILAVSCIILFLIYSLIMNNEISLSYLTFIKKYIHKTIKFLDI